MPNQSSIIGKEETFLEKLRSILAQLEYAHQIRQWTSNGVPFDAYFYVPEVLPETDNIFLEREDEAHVLKVILILESDIYHIMSYLFRELLLILEMEDLMNFVWRGLWKLLLMNLLV